MARKTYTKFLYKYWDKFFARNYYETLEVSELDISEYVEDFIRNTKAARPKDRLSTTSPFFQMALKQLFDEVQRHLPIFYKIDDGFLGNFVNSILNRFIDEVLEMKEKKDCYFYIPSDENNIGTLVSFDKALEKIIKEKKQSWLSF